MKKYDDYDSFNLNNEYYDNTVRVSKFTYDDMPKSPNSEVREAPQKHLLLRVHNSLLKQVSQGNKYAHNNQSASKLYKEGQRVLKGESMRANR
jgi:hypothetical protein